MKNISVNQYPANVVNFPIPPGFGGEYNDPCVNWRSGSLRPYESIAGFAVKFCYLNKIGPSEFIKFLERFISRFQPKEFWMVFDRIDFNIDRLARVLGEPNLSISMLRQKPFRPPLEYIGRNAGFHNEDSASDIVYCPDCIQYGYHAIFHQLPWIKRCLIHGSTLQKKWNINIKSYVRQDVLLIRNLYNLLFSEESNWSYDDYDSWIGSQGDAKSSSISLYLSSIDEVWVNGSLVNRSARKYGGFTPQGTSRVSELLRRLGGFYSSQIMGLDFLFEINHSIKSCLKIDKYHYERLLNLSSDISGIALARKEWAILLGEETIWSKNAVESIEAMLRDHQNCWNLYSRIKRRPSETIHITDVEFSNACQRVVHVRHLHEHWLVPWIHREDLMGYDRVSIELSYSGFIGRELEACGLANGVKVQKICVNPDGEAQIYLVDAWELDTNLKSVLDLLLCFQLAGQLWSIYNHEQKTDGCGDTWFSAHGNHGVDWCLHETEASSGELVIWSPYGKETPDWNSTPSGVQHVPKVR